MPQTIDPPILTPQSPVCQEPIEPVSSLIEDEQKKVQLQSYEINANASAQVSSITGSQVPAFISSDQQIPYSNSSTPLYNSLQTATIQNNSASALPLMNLECSSQHLNSTAETIKPVVLMPQMTHLPSFTTQELTTVNTTHDPTMSTKCPSQQSSTADKSTYPALNVYSSQDSSSQYYPTDVGANRTITDLPRSKDISNYFNQVQTHNNSSNTSSTIPMFSVKNFPQMSPLAQPIGKICFDLFIIKVFSKILIL